MNEIAVLIPCYNEELTISKVIKDFKKELPNANIYVYDNNSTDKSVKLAKDAGAIVRYEYKQGKGNVVRSMFRDIDAKCYILVDGDDTYSAKDAKKMCELIFEGKADMVIGDRLSSTYFKENKRLFHNFGNQLVVFLVNKLFHNNIKDIMSGYRVFNYNFVKGFPILSKGFEIETEMTIHAVDKNYKVKEITIDYKDRIKGSNSKLNTYTDGFKVLKIITSLFREYRPLAFFTFIAIMLILISIILVYPIISEYFKTGLVPRFPTLIVSGFIALTAILLLITGIILDVIVKKNKQTYELYMNFFININKKN